MMKKNVGFLLWILLSIFITSCTKTYREADAEKEEEIVPPGETYTPEQMHNLNVVYYVPADVDTLNLWHKRLSGLTLNTQKFFKENMQRNRFDKTFGLVVNDSNQNYITISYIKSKREASYRRERDGGRGDGLFCG